MVGAKGFHARITVITAPRTGGPTRATKKHAVAVPNAGPHLPTRTDMANGGDFDWRPFQAGQIQNFYSHWKDLDAPAYILKIINGYRIPFIEIPPLIMPFQDDSFTTPSSPEMTKAIHKLKDQGALEVVTASPSFLSTMFLVEKGDGSLRPIFNLRALNWFVQTEKFRLINVARIPDFLQSKDWLVKIDLSQAYFHIQVVHSHRRFLRLIYANQLLQMTCLPFGLSSAPRVFASVSNWIAQKLREQGVRILVYLDDYLIAHQNPQTLRIHADMTINMLQQLGWQINWEKSVLAPQARLEYLGVGLGKT